MSAGAVVAGNFDEARALAVEFFGSERAVWRWVYEASTADKFTCVNEREHEGGTDKNPSMSFIPNSDGKTCKCFVCGWTGDWIDAHGLINGISDAGKALQDVIEKGIGSNVKPMRLKQRKEAAAKTAKERREKKRKGDPRHPDFDRPEHKKEPAFKPINLAGYKYGTHYIYTGKNGRSVLVKTKFLPIDPEQRKQYRWSHIRPGKSSWDHKGRGGFDPVAYNFHAIAAAERGAIVLHVEGEKDTETLTECGWLSTCWPGTEGYSVSASKEFQRFENIIIADNDKPGRLQAAKVAKQLKTNGCQKVRVVQLVGLPEKADVTDLRERFAYAYGDRMGDAKFNARIGSYIDGADPLTPHGELAPPGLYCGTDDAVMDVVLPQPIIGSWLREGYRCYWWGSPGVGKTQVAFALVRSLARGEPFGAFDTVKQVPVLFVDGELGTAEVKRRNEMYGLKGLPNYHWLPNDHPLFEPLEIDTEEGLRFLIGLCRKHRIKVVVLDPQSFLVSAGYNENDTDHALRIAKTVTGLKSEGIASWLNHHANTEGEASGAKSILRPLEITGCIIESETGKGGEWRAAKLLPRKFRAPYSEKRLFYSRQLDFIDEEKRQQFEWADTTSTQAELDEQVLRCLADGKNEAQIKECLGLRSNRMVTASKKRLVEKKLITKSNGKKQPPTLTGDGQRKLALLNGAEDTSQASKNEG